jgi:hypothetical protein
MDVSRRKANGHILLSLQGKASAAGTEAEQQRHDFIQTPVEGQLPPLALQSWSS